MDLPKIGKSDRGMLDGIKSKLGFAEPDRGYDNSYADDYGDEYGDGYGDYSEFDDYGPGYQDSIRDNGAEASRYEPYNSVTTRPSRASSRSTGVVPPKLVSIDDVRARTQVPDSLNRDPLPPRRVSTPSLPHRGERTMVDSTLPDPAEHSHTTQPRRERSESLGSLFAPTDGVSADTLATSAAGTSTTRSTATATTGASAASSRGFDPYEAYAGAGAVKHDPTRSLTVLKPASYAEVERIAKALKAGDAVVLALRNTPDNLAKRILDFSFGVSSALDASVDCVAEKVFVITRGQALSDAEKVNLRNQGVL